MAEGAVRQYFVRNDRGKVWGPLSLPTIELLLENGLIQGRIQLSEDGLRFASPGRFPEVSQVFPPELWGEGETQVAAGQAAGARAPAVATQAPRPEVAAAAPPPAPAGSAPPAQGDLGSYSVVRLYGLLAAGNHTGALTLKLQDRTLVIHFRKGNPDSVDSSHPDEAPGAALMRSGLITPQQLQQAEAARERFGGEVLGALFGLGLVQPADAFTQLAQRAQGILMRAVCAETGSFTYEPKELPANKAMPLGNRWGVLSELVRNMPTSALRSRLQHCMNLPVLKSNGSVAPNDLRLTPQEVRAMGNLDGVRTMARLVTEFPQEAERYLRLLFLLKEVDAVTFAGEAAPSAVPPPGAAAAQARPAPAAPVAPVVTPASAPPRPTPAQRMAAVQPPTAPAQARPAPAARPAGPASAPPRLQPAQPAAPAARAPTPPATPPPTAPPAAAAPRPAPAGAAAPPATPPPAAAAPRPAPAGAAAPPAPPPPAAAAPRPAPAGAAAPPAAPRPAAPAPSKPAAPAAPAAPALEEELGALRQLAAELKAQNHFERLGLQLDAQGPAIKIAYFKLAKQYHPDTIAPGSPPELEKLKSDIFAYIGEAYRTLSDDRGRARYVEELKSGASGEVDVEKILKGEEIFQKGTLLVKARRFADAAKMFEEAIGFNPDEAEFYAWRGYARFFTFPDKKTGFAEAFKDIQLCLKRNERCAQAHYFHGVLSKLCGDGAGALKHFQRTVELQPNHIDAQREIRLSQQRK